MEQESQNYLNQLKSIRILIYSLIASLVIASIGFAFSVQKTTANLNQKDTQIHTLTDEVGQLKHENTFLNSALDANREIIQESFSILHASIKDYVETDKIEKTDEFNDAKNDLITIISDKEYKINNLQTQNQKLNQELQFHQYDSDIINILVLGEHDLLTDTIILMSINPGKKTITLINIPRDLYINGRKINSIYSSYGIERTLEEIVRITGIYAEKHVIVNFESFVKMIDLIGGIDINVSEDIYDPYFPNEANGHTVYEITAGNHHLSGKEALMYARSRKSTSDFDRAKRQQLVIEAIINKIKVQKVFIDLENAIEIFETVSSTLKTNIDAFEALYYLNHFKGYEIEGGNVINTEKLLYSSKTIDGQYILLPKSEDYYQVKKMISELIKK